MTEEGHVAERPQAYNPLAMGAIGKTVLFTILVPGTVAGIIPWGLRGASGIPSGAGLRGGLLFVALGVAVYAHTAFWGFALRGRGTPAPMAPTQTLVASGLHRYVRNPMYLGVLLIVFGQAWLFASAKVAIYGLFLMVAFHLFVLFYEEPTLQKQFGSVYDAYRKRVPRWIPKI